MISEKPLLQKQGAAFPQPFTAIYCGKVIISPYLRNKKSKKELSDLCVRMWALGLKPQQLMVTLGVISNLPSVRHAVDCKRAITHFKASFLLNQLNSFPGVSTFLCVGFLSKLKSAKCQKHGLCGFNRR